MKLPSSQSFHFDIDEYLNRIVPRSQLYRVPKSISWFLGYRDRPLKDVGSILICLWAFVGTFCGLSLVSIVYLYSPGLQAYNIPVLFASFGASAVLEYNTIQSPLGQPRNSVLGHAFSAIIGVGVTKLFMLVGNYEDLKFVAAAVACGLASSAMSITNTVHPPGGASAVLAAIDPRVVALGWHFVPFVILGTVLMLIVALLVNNIQRRFPVFWWTPADLTRKCKADVERVGSEMSSSSST